MHTAATKRKRSKELPTSADNADAAEVRSFTSQKLDWITAMIADHRLDARAKIVGVCIAQHINQHTRTWILSDEVIADKTGIPKRGIQRARRSLRTIGWVGWKRTGDANLYWTLSEQMDSVLDRQRSLKAAGMDRRARSKIDKTDSPPVAVLTPLRLATRGGSDSPPVASLDSPPMANRHLHTTPSGHPLFKRKPDRETRWPDGFSLNDKMTAIAAEKGFNQQQAEQMFEAFESHHRGLGSRREDWVYAWKGWVIRRVEIDAKSNTRAETDRNYIDGRL